jgi:hypothetical protein
MEMGTEAKELASIAENPSIPNTNNAMNAGRGIRILKMEIKKKIYQYF